MAHYKGDPVANSILILTVLKCLQILDKTATMKYPQLLEHDSGVDLFFMDRLLLPNKADMELAQELGSYFRARRAEKPSIISDNIPSAMSFPVRFAEQDAAMEALRNQILTHTQQMIEEKIDEVIRVREECTELRKQISSISCDTTWSSYYEQHVHSGTCRKCSLKNQLEYKLSSVQSYEKPLPESVTMQRAVVFELMIPTEVAILRDMLYFFQTDILNCLPSQEENLQMDWMASPVKYCPGVSISNASNYRLGSSTKLTLSTHYHSRNNSVDECEDSFVLNNGLNTIYYGNCTLNGSRTTVENRCTFNIRGSSTYAGMQWAVDGSGHTSNEVLSRQCECPPALSIPEFVQFGSHRAGEGLQYRNLVVALTNGHLSLKAEEVLALLAQSLWQTGSRENGNKEQSWVPNAHRDLLDDVFARELLQIVNAKIIANAKKWSDPWTLYSLATIVSRILEVGNVLDEASTLLRKCRQVAHGWISTVSNLLEKARHAKAPEKEITGLKKNVLLSALALLQTFNVSPEYNSQVLVTQEDMFQWLEAISVLYNDLLWNFLGRSKALGLPKITRILVRMAIAAALVLEESMVSLLSRDDEALKMFSRSKWRTAHSFTRRWEKCEGSTRQVWRCQDVQSTSDGSNHLLYLDVLLGRFLVDGNPLGRLPEAITRSPLYQRSFQKAEFQVIPRRGAGGITIFSSSFGNVN